MSEDFFDENIRYGGLDGYSRFLVHWDLREQMTEADVEVILERTKERYPGVRPRVISDNGPQFIAKDFKEFIRLSGMTHVRTSPYYQQHVRLNSAIGYITPKDMLAGHQQEIQVERIESWKRGNSGRTAAGGPRDG